ncbi:MAG: glycosyltransferase family 2 protein [Gammaproteobacteria bacterium]|nr:glycosyltransferase family 2 protein [Gammaproteobacteria bacterium]
MKLSIIFSTFNRNDILTNTLQGLVDMNTTDLDWEVILVDNAGNKETASIASTFSSVLPLKFLVEKMPGKNNALNTALEHATGELFIFTDDDIIADSAWVKSMLGAAERWPDCDLFGGRILPKYPEGEAAPPINDKQFMSVAYVIADWNLPEGKHFPETKIWGPNMMVRRRVFDRDLRFNPDIGPNGSNYIMGSESDFLKRARSEGYQELYVPTSLVYHQIRPEQLTHAWLYGRAFRLGRMIPYQGIRNLLKPDLKLRKWMLREIIRLLTRHTVFNLFGSEANKLESGIEYNKLRGHIYQCFKRRNG